MAHDTHNHGAEERPSVVPFKSAFWLVLILVGLYIASLNFIEVESKGDEGEKGEKTEMKAPEAKEAATPKAAEAPKAAENKPAEAPKSESKKDEPKD